MDLIKRIEIKHFRSIDEVVIDGLSDINVISGLNDVGKSNVMKALNLFFNFQVDWQNDLDFDRDLNRWHLHQARHAHDKREISVKLEFARPEDKYKSLPNMFWIKREWDKDNQRQPLETTWGKAWHSEAEPEWKRGLTWFLKYSKFVYVPAVRDRQYLRHLLALFSKTITDTPDKPLKNASEIMSNLIDSRSSDLRRKLKRATGIDVRLQIPQTMLALLEASGLLTEEGIPLELRGDGIQSLAVFGILADLNTKESSYRYIWGFEEPENSLEYIRAAKLADEILESYSRDAQVFITTHSPAFISMKNNKTSIFQIKPENKLCEHQDHEEKYASTVSTVSRVFRNSLFNEVSELSEDLGFLEVMRRIDHDFREYESLKENYKELKLKLGSLDSPILIVEGKNDCLTLRHAWSRLYQNEMLFDIVEAGGAGGITSLLSNGRTNARLIFGLYDHEIRGVKEIKKLSKYDFEQFQHDTFFEYRYKHFILARTLHAPPGRECNANNLNLSLEHYFSDAFLLQVHSDSDKMLFSKNNYVKDRERYHADEEALQREIENGRLTVCHRSFENEKGKKQSGKSYLVKCLKNLPNEDFEVFDSLFTVVINHLVPGSALERKTH